MPTIESLQLTPVKSLRAIEDVPSLTINGLGLVVGDRQYMFVEGSEHIHTTYKRGHLAQPGRFLSQREDPGLTGIVPTVTPDGLLLIAEGQEDLQVLEAEDIASNRIPVSVWGWEGEGVDQGSAAAEWASEAVGRAARLVAVSNAKPRYVENNPALGRVGFADGYPLTVASPEAYTLLNRQLATLGLAEIPRNRTRTTCVLAGLELPNAAELPDGIFPDDYVETITIASGGLRIVFRRRKACGRCPVPDTDQITGARKGRPVLTALTKLGRHGYYADQERDGTGAEVFFSQNFTLELPTDMAPTDSLTINSGDEVTVEYSNQTNWLPK